jgi:hypothetical protein
LLLLNGSIFASYSQSRSTCADCDIRYMLMHLTSSACVSDLLPIFLSLLLVVMLNFYYSAASDFMLTVAG